MLYLKWFSVLHVTQRLLRGLVVHDKSRYLYRFNAFEVSALIL